MKSMTRWFIPILLVVAGVLGWTTVFHILFGIGVVGVLVLIASLMYTGEDEKRAVCVELKKDVYKNRIAAWTLIAITSFFQYYPLAVMYFVSFVTMEYLYYRYGGKK